MPVFVRALLHASRHPRALTSWLCLHLELLAGQQTSHPGGWGVGGQMRSPSPYPISSSHHHHHTHTLHPNPSLSLSLFPPTLSLSEVSGDSGPCYLAPPFIVEERRKREGERERLQPTTTMSPEAPCLPACLPAPPAAQYSCGSAPDPDQLGSQPCQRATSRGTVRGSSSPPSADSSLR